MPALLTRIDARAERLGDRRDARSASAFFDRSASSTWTRWPVGGERARTPPRSPATSIAPTRGAGRGERADVLAPEPAERAGDDRHLAIEAEHLGEHPIRASRYFSIV